MDYPKAYIDRSSVTRATDSARYYAERRIAQALRYLADDDKKKREEAATCAFCYYMNSERIGGAACTSRPCGICEKEMSFGSTATDVICRGCGRYHQLCVQCGGDLQMRPRRKFNAQFEFDKS
jgi:hypothetical protein